MEIDDLRSVLERLQAVPVDDAYFAPCPICQPAETRRDKFRVRVQAGTERPVILICRACGASATREILATRGVGVDELGERESVDAIRGLWASVGVAEADALYPCAPIETRDAAYLAMLDGGRCDLPEHVERWLIARQPVGSWSGYRYLPPGRDVHAEIAQDVAFAVGEETLPTIPGFARSKGVPVLCVADSLEGLLIPQHDHLGRVAGIKFRTLADGGDGPRYKSLSSRAWRGPRAPVVAHVRRGTKKPDHAIVVEGERKADAVSALTGFTVISSPGARAWAAVREPLEALGVTTAILAMDQDRAGWSATLDMVTGLPSSFALAYFDWPSRYKGLDDALQAGIRPAYFASGWVEEVARRAGVEVEQGGGSGNVTTPTEAGSTRTQTTEGRLWLAVAH